MSPLPLCLAVLVKQQALGPGAARFLLLPAAATLNAVTAVKCAMGARDVCFAPRVSYLDPQGSTDPLWQPAALEAAVNHSYVGDGARLLTAGSLFTLVGTLLMLIAPRKLGKLTSRVALLGASMIGLACFQARVSELGERDDQRAGASDLQLCIPPPPRRSDPASSIYVFFPPIILPPLNY
jgi:hypothetical protein